MRLQSKDRLDLYDQAQFTHPIRLHRRDPRAGPGSGGAEALAEETPENLEDTKERERLELLKEQRRKQREENQAQIAPSLKPAKPNAFQKKTEQVFRTNDTPEAKKRAAIRYEEAVPWHLEDFDNKNTWVGSYEAALSECFMMLIEHEGGFRMVPVEKWYRFTNKVRGKTWTAEEADAAYATKLRPAEYMIQRQALDMQREAKLKERSQDRKMFVGKREDDLGRFRGAEIAERDNANDGNDLDYNIEDDFADDEEGVNGLFEGDEEEQKDTKNKIQQEQLGANVFGMTQEEHVWKREDEERRKKEEEAKLKKRTNKLMRKHEHNYLYEDDTDGENPYSSSVCYWRLFSFPTSVH
jgi:transcription initiation factor TFIIF subunit alpha